MVTRRPKVADMPEVQKRKVTELHLAGDNPRQIPQAAVEIVAESLKRFGWKQPLVIDGNDEIVVGHTRYRAAKLLKLREVPTISAADLSAEEIKAYRIADNRTHDFTSWDFPALVPQLHELAPDFSEVLALEDWEAIVQDFNDWAPPADVSDEVRAQMDGGFEVVVVFKSEQDALAAEQQLIDMPGVFDVRHKRK